MNAEISIQDEYSKRTRQYSTNGYKKILLYSPYRTGSTLVYNVLKFLFEKSYFLDKDSWQDSNAIVGKTHILGRIEPSTFIFCTIRNPVDACFSGYRVIISSKYSLMAPYQKIDEMALDSAVDDYIAQMESIDDLLRQKMRNITFLPYEDFNSNMEIIFDRIENIFDITICEIDRLLMEETFSKKNVSQFIKQFKNFSVYDTSSLFHGDHIEGNEFSKEQKTLICDEIKKRLLGRCDFLEKYGYVL